jgi:predicted transcriptional regulator
MMTRSKLDLLAYLLETARNTTTRTMIASQLSQNPELIDNSLTLLTDLGLLSETHNSPISFVATHKGLQFLSDYKHLREQLPFEKEIKENPKTC